MSVDAMQMNICTQQIQEIAMHAIPLALLAPVQDHLPALRAILGAILLALNVSFVMIIVQLAQALRPLVLLVMMECISVERHAMIVMIIVQHAQELLLPVLPVIVAGIWLIPPAIPPVTLPSIHMYHQELLIARRLVQDHM